MYITRKLKGWKWKFVFVLLLSVILCFLCFSFGKTKPSQKERIAIVVVIANGTNLDEYKIALDTVKCYSRIGGYDFKLVRDEGPKHPCMQKDYLFRRHCVTATILANYDVIMFLDADIGVVNPKRRIEEFMEDGADLIFYDRYQNWEVATGSYIVRNTQYAKEFLNEFANYESKLSKDSFHGSDNGAIHIFLAEKLFPPHIFSSNGCSQIYEKSKSFQDIFIFEACIRHLLDSHASRITTKKIKILKKGTGWTRDSWLTNSLWNPEVDFLLHGWKMSQLRGVPNWELRPIQSSRNQWFSPFFDRFDGRECTWNYDPRLLGDTEEIKKSLKKLEEDVDIMKKKTLEEWRKFH